MTSAATFVTVLLSVPYPKCAPSYYRVTQTTHTFCDIKAKWGSLLKWLLIGALNPNKISGFAPTCDSAHLWWHYRVAPLTDQTASTMTWYRTQSHYPNSNLTGLWPIIIMPITWIRSDTFLFLSNLFDSTRVRTGLFESCDLPKPDFRNVNDLYNMSNRKLLANKHRLNIKYWLVFFLMSIQANRVRDVVHSEHIK